MQTVSAHGEGTVLRRERLASTGSVDSATAEPASDPGRGLAEFVTWGVQAAPARHYALLVMGHGAGLLQAPTLPPDTLRPVALREGLELACNRLGQPLDVVGLDTCYGGTLEIAYSLRKVCRYLTAAPGLIYSPGLDWAGALADLSVRPEAPTLVRGLVRRGMPQRDEPLALVGLDLRQLEPLCGQVQRLNRALQADHGGELPILIYARSHTQSWGDHSELVDLGVLAESLSSNGLSADVRGAAGEVLQGLTNLIMCRWESAETTACSGSGVGVYFPPTFEAVPPEYAKSYEFASTSEWGKLLDFYWTRLTSALSGPNTR